MKKVELVFSVVQELEDSEVKEMFKNKKETRKELLKAFKSNLSQNVLKASVDFFEVR